MNEKKKWTSKEKKNKDGSGDPIYDDCDECGEMLVVTQCVKCKKWICTRCYNDHYC